MKTEIALYHAVHDFKGGTVALAENMGMARSSLLNMVNPNDGAHEATLKRFRQIVHLTGDQRPVHALCQEMGGVFVPIERFSGIADDALLDTMARLGKEFGDVCAALAAAIADGSVTAKELAGFDAQKYELDQVGAELRARLAGMVPTAPGPAGQVTTLRQA